MKARIKKLWVAALRSGEYEQTRNVLRNRDGFCCLGVLCNLHAQAHPKIAATQRNPDIYLRNSTCLPPEVWKWAGLSDCNPDIQISHKNGETRMTNLAAVNDRGHSFLKIADLIENQL